MLFMRVPLLFPSGSQADLWIYERARNALRAAHQKSSANRNERSMYDHRPAPFDEKKESRGREERRRGLPRARPLTGAYLPSFQMSVASFQSLPTFSQTTTYLPVPSCGGGPIVLRL